MDIYNVDYVEKLFDEMAGTYELVNYLSSFGFSHRWRKQFVNKIDIQAGMVICDLMCGMGECWSSLAPRLAPHGQLVALDLSQGMLHGARKQAAQFPHLTIQIIKENALINGLADESADCVICGFGLKTFSEEQKEILAAQIQRILKPNGVFSIIEVSVPTGWFFQKLYMFYLKRVIPLIGSLLLGNPENYRMLGVYTEKFGDSRSMMQALAYQGLSVEYHHYFYGCATGVSGMKLELGKINPFD